MKNAISVSMNEVHYNIDALNDHQDMYPLTVTEYVQPYVVLHRPTTISTKLFQAFLTMILQMSGSTIIHPRYFLTMDNPVMM